MRHYIIRLGPLGKVPIPRWTAHGFGIGALAWMCIWLYGVAYPAQLVTAQQANAELTRVSVEYGKHIGDTPEHAFADADGAVRVVVYKDHCVAVNRRVGGAVLIVAPAEPAPKTTVSLVESLMAASACADPRFVHAGKFVQRTGERRGDWVEIWRLYDDGCEHVQLFQPATGAWDANADGTPRVRWTRCQH